MPHAAALCFALGLGCFLSGLLALPFFAARALFRQAEWGDVLSMPAIYFAAGVILCVVAFAMGHRAPIIHG